MSPEDERFVRAGELSLGVLEGEALAAARREQLADGEFAEAVEWWDLRIGLLAEEVDAAASRAEIWQGIERRLFDRAEEGGPAVIPASLPRRPAGWSVALAVGGAGLAAAALALFLATPQTGSVITDRGAAPAQAGPQLVAQISDDSGALSLASVIDRQGDRLALKVRGFQPGPEESPELWVVPEGGNPVSLGLIPASGEFERPLTQDERELLVEGALLAVTIERRVGAPHDAPTTPILVAGPLDEV